MLRQLLTGHYVSSPVMVLTYIRSSSTHMRRTLANTLTILIIFLLEASPNVVADPTYSASIGPDGTVHLPSFDLPLSSYMSEQAQKSFIETARRAAEEGPEPTSIYEIRKKVDIDMQQRVKALRASYPVDVRESTINGVRTDIITPQQGIPSSHRNYLLIDLHGGGFGAGAVWLGLVESIPISSIGRFKVVTVDYRMAPEYQFPAASEDVAAVYSYFLKQYRPQDIGIYGCSAGGILSAMTVAWLRHAGKPAPGALGILSASAFAGFGANPSVRGSWGGDSRYVASLFSSAEKPVLSFPMPYLSKVGLDDPLVSPAISPTMLAQFPPTLLLTGTRAYDLSAAIQTQRELTRVGVEADLQLWDGMGHCFFLDGSLPESREAFGVIVKFFDDHLGRITSSHSSRPRVRP
jgi:epsilon-lactone hydrolase